MWPLAEAIKDQRASPQTRCFTWQVLSAACPWNIQSEWKTDEFVKNIQKVTGRHKAPEMTGVCQSTGPSRYGFNLNNSEHTVHHKLLDGVRDKLCKLFLFTVSKPKPFSSDRCSKLTGNYVVGSCQKKVLWLDCPSKTKYPFNLYMIMQHECFMNTTMNRLWGQKMPKKMPKCLHSTIDSTKTRTAALHSYFSCQSLVHAAHFQVISVVWWHSVDSLVIVAGESPLRSKEKKRAGEEDKWSQRQK